MGPGGSGAPIKTRQCADPRSLELEPVSFTRAGSRESAKSELSNPAKLSRCLTAHIGENLAGYCCRLGNRALCHARGSRAGGRRNCVFLSQLRRPRDKGFLLASPAAVAATFLFVYVQEAYDRRARLSQWIGRNRKDAAIERRMVFGDDLAKGVAL